MRTGHNGDQDEQAQNSREWGRRPALSRSLRVAVFAGPVAASFVVAAVLTHLLPHADSPATAVLWAGTIAAASLVTLVVLERAAHRLLPLAALLNLSLVFPDKAPARFAVARRTGRPRDLQESLHRARETGHEDDARRMQSIIELVLALSVHDKASRGHSERVRVFTDLLADELKVPANGRNRLRWAALLHDIGKLEVPATILNKPGTPDDAEWASLHRHPEEGARLVGPLLPWLGEWGTAVEQHHERFDGTGYPHKLKGHEISLAARIVAVADAYEVMTAPRPYKRVMSVTAARAELVRVAGTQLDPVIVRAFLNVSVGRLWRTIGFGAWIAQIPQLGRIFGFGGWAGSGMGMGIASATTATVLAVTGVVGPGPSAVPVAPVSAPLAVAVTHTPRPEPTGTATPLPATATPAPQSAAPTTTPSPSRTATAAPTARPTAIATPKPTLRPTPSPTATPKPTPSPTATPTPSPSPTPDPWSCAGCTNTSRTCTNHCNSVNNTHCFTYCEGNGNSSCRSHCFGDNDWICTSYCDGDANRCVSNCRDSSVVQATTVRRQPPSRRPALHADTMLNATMTTTSAMVIRPLY